MQINKELLERALVEGAEVEHHPERNIISLATKENTYWTGFHTTLAGVAPSEWEYVCTVSEYLKAKAEKEKMQENEFKVGDLVDVIESESKNLLHSGVALKYISEQNLIVSNDWKEFVYSIEFINLRHHRKTQDWFGVEIDAFMTENPEQGVKYWYFANGSLEGHFKSLVRRGSDFGDYLFESGIWDTEEKAKRSAPLMRQRLIEMAGVK